MGSLPVGARVRDVIDYEIGFGFLGTIADAVRPAPLRKHIHRAGEEAAAASRLNQAGMPAL